MNAKNGECFLQAAALLPTELRTVLMRLPDELQACAEEIRLRSGWPGMLVMPEGERAIPGWPGTVCPADLERVLEIATQASAHAALDRVQNGFFTVPGGHRIGICGSAVQRQGAVWNLRALSSLSIRIAREVHGVSRGLLRSLWTGERLYSTLILSPPGGGKTTLLRDLIRSISDGDGIPARRVGIADERGELAGLYRGVPQFNIGRRSDVMDGCANDQGLLMLLRGMNPQVLAADEITAPEDATALEMAANCGVDLLCTAHGTGLEDLQRRLFYRKLLERKVFERVVTIRRTGFTRSYQVQTMEGTPC